MEQITRFIRDVETEVKTEKFIKLYQSIREQHSRIKSFSTPEDLVSSLHNQNNPDYALNDSVLSALIVEYLSRPQASLIGSYLIVLFKPGLLSLFTQFRRRALCFASISEADLWFQIIGFFLEEIKKVGLAAEETKIASKVLGRLRNRLRGHFSKLFKELQSEREINQDAFHPNNVQAISPEDIVLLLEKLAYSGVISETDKYILLASCVYGRSMREVSKELNGISYESIRQRKVRVKKAIAAYLEKSKNSLSQFSP